VEVGQEAQSMERNDLQLITSENPSEVPEWVAPFDSAQLRSLLVAMILALLLPLVNSPSSS
jgi:hypothetical protein